MALVVRLVAVALFHTEPWGDLWWNDAVGWNLATGRGFTASPGEPRVPGVYRTPAYPAMLGLVYYLFGHSLVAAYIVQAVIDSVAVVVLGLIAIEVASVRIATLAALLYALYPYPAVLCGVLHQDILLTFFVLVAILLTVRAAAGSRGSGRWLLAGICTGLTGLVKANFVLFALVPALTMLMACSGKRRRASALMALASGVVLTIGPWVVRNYLVFGSIPPLAIGGTGTNLVALLRELGDPRPPTVLVDGKRYPVEIEPVQIVDSIPLDGAKLIAAETELVRRAAPELLQRWPRYFRQAVNHVLWLWVTRGAFYQSWAVNLVAVASSLVLLVLGIAGIFLLRRSWRTLLPLHLAMVIVTLMHVPIRAEARYTLPVRPLLLLFVAVSLNSGAVWLRRRRD